MQVDLEFLKKHYASLSDEAFDEVDRGELVGAAQKLYDEERSQRGHPAADVPPTAPIMTSAEPEPDWLTEAACAGSFRVAQYDAPEAEARAALEAAGIPVHTDAFTDPPAARPTSWVRLMIPSRDAFRADSILDREIYNPEIEETWKTHLASLSDREFKELDFEALLSGLTDRLERLRRVYKKELAARS